VLFLGCVDLARLAESLVPEDEDKYARDCLELLRTRDYEPIISDLDPSVTDGNLRAALEAMSDTIGGEVPRSVTLVGSHVFTMSDLRKVTLTYQLELPDGWALATLVLTSRGDGQMISSFRLQPIADSLENLNSLTFKNTGVLHYVFLLFVVVVPAFIIFAAVLLFRTKIKRKWLWFIFILLGFVQFTFNWTSGDVGFRPIAFGLLGAGMFRASPYAPWIISIALPIGAVVFLAKRRSIKQSEKAVSNLESGEPDRGRKA